MRIANVARIAGTVVTGRNGGLKTDPYVRPYTQFQRSDVYRFKSADVVFRPFRVA
jgi:hypothetical protein